MGLNERRKIKELQDTIFPAREKEIEEISGKAIPYEVDWDSLADDAEALNFIDNLYALRTEGMHPDGAIRELLLKKL